MLSVWVLAAQQRMSSGTCTYSGSLQSVNFQEQNPVHLVQQWLSVQLNHDILSSNDASQICLQHLLHHMWLHASSGWPCVQPCSFFQASRPRCGSITACVGSCPQLNALVAEMISGVLNRAHWCCCLQVQRKELKDQPHLIGTNGKMLAVLMEHAYYVTLLRPAATQQVSCG